MNLYQKEEKEENEGYDLEVAYWRKHPSLHHYLFSTYAPNERKDNLTELYLGENDLKKIIRDIKNDVYGRKSPGGFFWGESYLVGDENYEQQKANDKEIFEKALQLMQTNKKPIYYQAWY